MSNIYYVTIPVTIMVEESGDDSAKRRAFGVVTRAMDKARTDGDSGIGYDVALFESVVTSGVTF